MFVLIISTQEQRVFRAPEAFTHNDVQFPADVFRWSREEQWEAGLDIRPLVTDPQPDPRQFAIVESTFEVLQGEVREHYVLRDLLAEETAAVVGRLQAEKVSLIKGRRESELLHRPYPLAGGRLLQLDKESKDLISDTALQASVVKASNGLIAWPARMIEKGWRMADNTWYPLPTPDHMLTLGLWAAHEYERLRDVAWHHIDHVRSLTDAAAIEAYDIETGWAGEE